MHRWWLDQCSNSAVLMREYKGRNRLLGPSMLVGGRREHTVSQIPNKCHSRQSGSPCLRELFVPGQDRAGTAEKRPIVREDADEYVICCRMLMFSRRLRWYMRKAGKEYLEKKEKEVDRVLSAANRFCNSGCCKNTWVERSGVAECLEHHACNLSRLV